MVASFKLRTVLESDAVRFALVFVGGVLFSLLALVSVALPSRIPFDILAWPVAFMSWLFPAPCFDRGPGMEPFCEGTPIQLIAGVVGFFGMLLFYWFLLWLLLRLSKRRSAA